MAERTPRASSPEPRVRKRRRLVVPAAAAILLLAARGCSCAPGRAMAAWRRWSRASRAPSRRRQKPRPPAYLRVPPTRARTRGPRRAGAAQTTAAGSATARGPRQSAVPVVSASAITLPPAFGPAPSIVMAQPAVEDVSAGARILCRRSDVRRGQPTRFTRGPMRRSRRRGRSTRRCLPIRTGNAARGSHRPRPRRRCRRAGGARADAHVAARCP